jgi:glycosyltransferase involved in cell wall biosynthesis
MQRPKFSIIAVDYEKHVPRDGFRKGIESLANQTFKDFELIICHDGPKEVPYSDEIDFAALKDKLVDKLLTILGENKSLGVFNNFKEDFIKKN